LLGTNPVLPGYEISQTTTIYDEAGAIVRKTVQQRPERGAPFEVPEGHLVKGISSLIDADGREIQRWVKTREGASPESLADALREALEEHRGRASLPEPLPHADDDLLTLYALPDLHLGALSWGKETGENYDLGIACRTIRDAASELVSQSRPTRHAIMLGMGDYFHMNDRTNQTPKSGHVLDVDGRWPKVYKAGARVAVDLAHMVAERHPEVELRFLQGNHDPDAAVALTVALALYFDGHERINVNDSPSIHYYRRFGKVLLGATHGHTMKPDRMAMMLAVDRAKDWGEAEHRHFVFGHVHHEQAREVGGVRVESFNSPAAKDAYAHAGGWRSGRSLVAITFHRERGEVGRHRVNITA